MRISSIRRTRIWATILRTNNSVFICMFLWWSIWNYFLLVSGRAFDCHSKKFPNLYLLRHVSMIFCFCYWQEEVAAEAVEGRGVVRMLCIHWRFPLKIYTMALQRNFLWRGKSSVWNVKGMIYLLFWLPICLDSFFLILFGLFHGRTGSKSGASMKCSGCQGSGMKVSIRQLGPGMIQQVQHVCPQCKGSGMVL